MHRLTVDFSKPYDVGSWNELEFRTDLEWALKEICPAALLVLDEGSEVVPKTGHVEIDEDGLCISRYCAHRAGCNLLIDLTREPTDEEGYLPRTEIAQGCFTEMTPGDPNRVTWKAPYYVKARGGNPDGEDCPALGCDWCYYGPHPPPALLAHELIHAWHRQRGEFCGGFGAQAPEEICTVQSENQIRSEMGQRARCSYLAQCMNFPTPDKDLTWQLAAGECMGGANVGKYDCTLLSENQDRRDCGCGPSSWPSLLGMIKLVFCWGKGMAIHPLFRLDKKRSDSPHWRSGSGFGEMYDRHLPKLPSDSNGREMEALAQFLVRTREEFADPGLQNLLGRGLQSLLEEAPDAVVLELVSVHGSYELIAQFSLGDENIFVTTLSHTAERRKSPPTPKGSIEVHSLEPEEMLSIRRIKGEAPGRELTDGIGGTFAGIDGGAEFLQLKYEGEIVAVATRNLGIDASESNRDRKVELDAEDALRWRTIKAIMDWGHTTLAKKSGDGEPIK